MPIVNVKGLGSVKFPDDMSEEDIHGYLKEHFDFSYKPSEKLMQDDTEWWKDSSVQQPIPVWDEQHPAPPPAAVDPVLLSRDNIPSEMPGPTPWGLDLLMRQLAPPVQLETQAQPRSGPVQPPFMSPGQSLPDPLDYIMNPDPTWGQVAGAFPRQLAGGSVNSISNLMEFPVNAAEVASEYLPKEGGINAVMNMLGEVTRGAARKFLVEPTREKGQELSAPLPGTERLPPGSMKRAFQNAAASIGQSGTDIALGGWRNALKLMFADVSSGKYGDLIEKGYSPGGSAAIASLHGAAEVIGEKTPLGLLSKKWGPDWKKELVRFMGAEIAQEHVTEFLQAGIEKMTENQDMTWGEFKSRYLDFISSLPVSVAGMGAAGKARSAAENFAIGRPLGMTPESQRAQALGDEINAGAEQATPDAIQSVIDAFSAGQQPLGEKAAPATPAAAEQAETQPTAVVGSQPPERDLPISERTKKYLDPALQNLGYESLDEVPDEQLEAVAHAADELFKESIAKNFIEGYQQDISETYKELEDAAFEIRNIQLEGRRLRGADKAATSRMAGGATATVDLMGSKSADANEAGLTVPTKVRLLKRSGDTALAAFESDIPEFGIKAGDRVEFNPQTGELLTGFGTGPYAASRTGTLSINQSSAQTIRNIRFSKRGEEDKGTMPFDFGMEDEFYGGETNPARQNDIDDAWYSVLTDVDDGRLSINEAAQELSDLTGLPRDHWLAELEVEYPEGDPDALIDYNSKYYEKYSAKDYKESNWVDSFWDRAESTFKDSPGGKATGYTYWKRTPGWALDGHLAEDATGKRTSGTPSALPDSIRALKSPRLGGARSLRARLNRKQQKVVSRALLNILDSGFPKGVVDSINAFAIQTEKKYVSVSAAYDGKRHEVRFSKYVLDDLEKNREEQGYQQSIQFLLTHELTHAMESDRREYTLSMQSPLFDISSEAIKLVPKQYVKGAFDIEIDDSKLGPVIAEMIEAWNSNRDLASILSYPYASLSSVTRIKSERKRRAELNRIRAESFAQLGALYYNYPELVKEHIPSGYKLFEEITNVADQKSYRERRRALRGPLWNESPRGSNEDVREESRSDAGSSSDGRENRTRFSRTAGVGRDELNDLVSDYADQIESSEISKDDAIKELMELGEVTRKRATALIGAELGNRNTARSAPSEEEIKAKEAADKARADERTRVNNLFAKNNTPNNPEVLFVSSEWTNGDGVIGYMPSYVHNGVKTQSKPIVAKLGLSNREKRRMNEGRSSAKGFGLRHGLLDYHGAKIAGVNIGLQWKDAAEGLDEIAETLRRPDDIRVDIQQKGNVAIYRTLSKGTSPDKDFISVVAIGKGVGGRMELKSVFRGERSQSHERTVKVSSWEPAATVALTRTSRKTGSEIASRHHGRPGDTVAKTQTVRKKVVQARYTRREILNIINRITKHWKGGPRFVVIDSVDDLAEMDSVVYRYIQSQKAGDPLIEHHVRALYDGDKTAYIVRGNIDSPKDLLIGIFHEARGHFAMHTFFGTELNGFLDNVYRVHKDEINKKDGAAQRNDANTSTIDGQRYAAEEYMAELAQEYFGVGTHAMPKKIASLWDRFVHAVRNAARKLFNIRLNKSDINVMMSAAIEDTVVSRAVGYAPGAKRYGPMLSRIDRPFYSQLEAMIATQAPAEGTPEQYLTWLDKSTKGNEKIDVDVEPMIEHIIGKHMYNDVLDKKTITDLMGKENFNLPKKFVNTYWQQSAPKKARAQEYVAFLRNAERAAAGGPVKKEEIDTLKLREFLESAKGSKDNMSRADIAMWVNANQFNLNEVYRGKFSNDYNDIIEDVYGTQLINSESIDSANLKRKIRVSVEHLNVYHEYTEDYDEDTWDEYYSSYISENEYKYQYEEVSEEFDRDDYIDSDGYRTAINDRAEELAEEWNEENPEEEERTADDFLDEAENDVDREDYFNQELFDEAVEERIEEIREQVDYQAREAATSQASDEARQIFREGVTGFTIEGNDNNEWRIYDNEGDEITDGFDTLNEAVEGLVEFLNDEEYYIRGNTLHDPQGDEIATVKDVKAEANRKPYVKGTKWGQYTINERENDNYRVIEMIVPKKFVEWNYQYTTHFDDINYLVYARVSDKTISTEDGDVSVLFIEELQSDWAGNQAGMVGFYSENKEATKKLEADRLQNVLELDRLIAEFFGSMNERQIEINKTEYEFNDFFETMYGTAVAANMMYQSEGGGGLEFGYPQIITESADSDSDGKIFEIIVETEDKNDRQNEINNKIGDIRNKILKINTDIMAHSVSVPDVPLSSTYIAVMMKRLARLAVDEGYEGIAVSKGLDHTLRWGSNVFAWTNLRDSKLPELADRLSTLQNRVERTYDAIQKARTSHLNRMRSSIETIKKYEEENKKDDYVDATPSIEKLRSIFDLFAIERIDSDGDIRSWPGYLRIGFGERNKSISLERTLAYYSGRDSIEDFHKKMSHLLSLVYGKGVYSTYSYGEYVDLGRDRFTDYEKVQSIISKEEVEAYAEQWHGDRSYLRAEYESAKEYLNTGVSAARQTQKDFRKSLNEYLSEIRDVERDIEEERKNNNKTLPKGQIAITSSNSLYGVVGSGRQNQDMVLKYPEDRAAAKRLYDSGSLNMSGKKILNIEDESFEKILTEVLMGSLASQTVSGPHGGYTTHSEIYRILPKFKQRILDSVDEDGIYLGIWARRAAGLNLVYDKMLVGKQSGLQMLAKKVEKGDIRNFTSRGPYNFVRIDEEFKAKWGRGQPMFSRKKRGTGQQRLIMDKIGKEGGVQKALEAIKEPGRLAHNIKESFLRNVLDSGLSFKRMVEQIAPNLPADEDPYVAWRLLAGDSAIIEDWLGLNGKWTAGTVPYHISDRLARRFGQSLVEVLSPVMQDKETMMDFIEYITARRAQELMAVGKENLFTDADIKYGLSLRSPLFDAAANRLYAYQDRLLQYSVEGGLLDPETAIRFRRYANYIPFFRESEYEGDVGTKKGSAFKRLKGGRQNIREPLQNIIENTSSIIHATNRNAALIKALHLAESRPDGAQWMQRVPMPKMATHLSTQRIVTQLQKQGVTVDPATAQNLAIMQTFFQNRPIGDEKNRIVILKERGKPIAVKVKDKGLWQALHAMAPMEFGLLVDALAIPAETIRTGIVLSPDFMAANLSRDTLSGFIQAKKGVRMVPFAGSAYGMVQAATGAEIAKLYRALGSGYADIWHGDSKEANASLSRLARIGKFRPGTVLNPATYWRLLRKIGTVTETGTRLRAFSQQLSKDPNDPANALLAALESREISVDFSLHGASKSLRILERVTPFLNPAKQGLYKMGRTLGDQPITSLLRGAPLVAMTFYLWLLNHDEDWYKDLEDWEKNTYWHFDIGIRSKDGDIIPMRLPKPFEYGALFGSFQEALFQYLYDRDGSEAATRAMSTIEDVFLLRGTPPSIVLPAELWANISSFTERPIVPEYLEGIDPRYQYGAGTSAVSRKIGEVSGLSPMKLDHTVRGMFGTLGMYTLMALEDPFVHAYGYEERPTRHWWQQPVMRRFFSDPLRPGGKAMTEFYDALKRQQMEQKTWKYLDFSKEYVDSLENKDSFAIASTKQIADLMSTIRKASREIRDSKTLTPDQKMMLIDANNRQLKSISVRWKTEMEKRKGE